MAFLSCVLVLVILGVVNGGLQPNPVPGGLFPVEENSEKVEACKKLILNTHREEEKAKNEAYETEVNLDNVKVYRQVVAGILYHLEYDLKTTHTCKQGSACENKAPETKKCTAVVLDDFINKKDLSIHKSPVCK